LVVACGVCGLVPLLKNQSSHYAFTGTAFLRVYAAIVGDWIAVESLARLRRFWVLASVAALSLCVVSGVLYRPDAVARLWRRTSFSEEDVLGRTIRQHVRADQFAIFLGHGTRAYWPSGRYPNWPLVNTDVQSTYYVQHHAARLLRALDDPRLALVEFNPEAPVFDDPQFARSPATTAFVREFSCRLSAGFARHDDVMPPLVVWFRSGEPTAPRDQACQPDRLADVPAGHASRSGAE
jgi:hypothetical protein